MQRQIRAAVSAAAVCLLTTMPAAQRAAAQPAAPSRTNIFTIAAGALVLTHSGEFNDNWAALNIIDGDPSTGWSAREGARLPATFVVELARSYRLKSIAFDSRQVQESGYAGISAKAVEIWTSNEGPET